MRNTKLNTYEYKTVLILCVSFVLITLSSCLGSQHQVAQANIEIDDGYVNKQILIRAPENFNSFKTNDPIVLEILNYSDSEIRFPNNYNLRIINHTDNGWVEIKEILTTRLPEEDIVFSPATSSIEDLAVFPDLVDYSRNYKLRIYVIGELKTDKGMKKVAAYVDVQLRP
jgi:hypothetical protein